VALPEIVRTISASDNFLITCHIRPDGDAIGSLLGMIGLLRALGKRFTAVSPDPVPEKYRFIPNCSDVMTVKQAEKHKPFPSIIILDAGEFDRIGEAKRLVDENVRIINIDHHVSNDGFGDSVWIDLDASATAEMLLTLFREFQLKPDPAVALALYIGIMTDTGRFRFSNTTSHCFASVAALVECGADPVAAVKQVYYNTDKENIITLGRVLSRIEVSDHDRIVTTYMTKEEINADTEGFVDYLTSIKGVEIALLFQETKPSLYKVSLRSLGKVDVAKIAVAFNGGGHNNAAGCRINGTFVEARNVIVEACRAAL